MTTPLPDDSVLDNPAWHSLIGPHAPLAIGAGLARRYPVEMSPFSALSDYSNPQAWHDLAELFGPGVGVGISGRNVDVPDGWGVVMSGTGLQMTGVSVMGEPDPEARILVDSDVPEMVALARLTEPGPFEERTIDFGGYLGIKRDGKLVAMAGQRLNPQGWVEISAVCTHPDFQRQGFAARLVLAVAHDVRVAGNVPFLHVRQTNTGAIAVYERLGFEARRTTLFEQLRTPSD